MKISDAQIDNLVDLLDGYAEKGGHQMSSQKKLFWMLRSIRKNTHSLPCEYPDMR